MDCQNYYITNALNALGNQIASLQDTSAINNQCQTYIFTLPTSITTNGCNNNFSINQVSYSSLNYRMWELKISATLLQPTSSILYIFNPLCLLPPNNISLKNIVFSSNINGYISTSDGVLSLNGSATETNKYVNLDWQPNNTTLTVQFSSLPIGDVYANLIFKDTQCGIADTQTLIGNSGDLFAVYYYCVNNSGSDGAYGGLQWSAPNYSSYNSTVNSTFLLNPTANPNQYALLITLSGNLAEYVSGTVLYLNYVGGAVGETSFITVQNNTNGFIYVYFDQNGPDNTVAVYVGNNVVYQCVAGLFDFTLYSGNYVIVQSNFELV
jgi:hypothetical protein